MKVCWIDHSYDLENAVLGVSRYAEHVQRHWADFADAWGDISPVGFACAAWRLATAPSLDPGFVRFHRRVLSAECRRNEWDGTLLAQVSLVSPWPQELSSSRVWARDRGWRDWPTTLGQFLAPSQHQLSKIPHARSVVLVDAPLPLDLLPVPPDEPGPHLPELAERTVAVLVHELNELLGPMVAELES